MERRAVLGFACEGPPFPGQESRSWPGSYATFDFRRITRIGTVERVQVLLVR